MAERRVVVQSPVGLHARPAALFAKAASGSGLQVTISKGNGPAVPASSILSVLTLNVSHGDGADAVLDELAALLASHE